GVTLGETPRGLDDDVGAELAPGELCRVLLGQCAHRPATDGQALLVVGHVLGEHTHDRVVLQEVGEGLVVGEVVDADDLDVRPRAEHGPEKAAADATEAVDSDADGHYVLLQCAGRRTQCRVFVERHEARRRRPPRWWGPSARTNLHLDKWDRRDEGPRTRPGMTDVTARSRPFSQ